MNGTNEIAKGAFETDILGGGLGSDTFVLGSANQAYYVSDGDKDFAIIQDFTPGIDNIQLNGSAGDYQQGRSGSDLYLRRGQELIAIFENTNNLDLNSGRVVFV